MFKRLAACITSLSLAGCGGVEVSQYADQQPQLILEEYFNGPIEAWGIFERRDGTVVKRFKVDIDARWDGNTGVLDEHFVYSDGTTQRRIWTIVKQSDGRYIGTADDVIGEAEGVSSGNALRWWYQLSLPVDGKVYQVTFDDWMFLMDQRTMINRSVMKKFGFRLGEVTLFFRKVDEKSQPSNH